MNIFVLDIAPRVSASFLADTHLNKQILESAQLVSTALRTAMKASTTDELALNWGFLTKKSLRLYKSYNPNGRFAKWLLSSQRAWIWHAAFLDECLRIYKLVTDKTHACSAFNADNLLGLALPGSSTKFVSTLPNKPLEFTYDEEVKEILSGFGVTGNNAVIVAYRQKYARKAVNLKLKWTYNVRPYWIAL